MEFSTEKVTKAFEAFMDLGADQAVRVAVESGMDEATAQALIAGFDYGTDDCFKPYNLAQQVKETLRGYAGAYASADCALDVAQGYGGYTDAGDIRNDIQSRMVTDGYPPDVAEAFLLGCSSSKPPAPEQLQELEKIQTQFDTLDGMEICLHSIESMKRLRTAKKLIAKVKTTMMKNGATAEAADAFLEGFLLVNN